MLALIVLLEKWKKALVIRARTNRVLALKKAAEDIDRADELLDKRIDNITKMANDMANNAFDKRDASLEVANANKALAAAELLVLDNFS